jgi:molecular chaperone GrpE
MAEESRDQAEAAVEQEEAAVEQAEAAVEQEDAAVEQEEAATGPAVDEAANEQQEPSDIEALRAELDAAREEARSHHDRYLRDAAETENYKKRVTREKHDAIRYANESLVRDLLPVIDDLERAAQHARTDGGPQSLLDGIELVLKGCLEALQKHGVTRITAKGEPFDPEKHEAYAQVETDEYEANTVVDEVHHGYYLADRLLRPSMVSVSKVPTLKEKDETTVENDRTDD